MKNFKLLSLLILVAVGLSSCSVHEVKSDGHSGGKGATIVKVSPFMSRLVSLKSELRKNGIKLSSVEVITSEAPELSATYSAETDEYIEKMKMENVLTVRDDEDDIDIFVLPIPKKEGMAKAMVFKIQEPDELIIVKLRGKFNFAKMIEEMEKDDGDDTKFDLGFVSVD